MDAATVVACALLLAGALAYIFWNQHGILKPTIKTRLDYLRERKDVVYDNLRDLNFEYRAGKYPAEDYAAERDSLENEAATIVVEMEHLEDSAAHR